MSVTYLFRTGSLVMSQVVQIPISTIIKLVYLNIILMDSYFNFKKLFKSCILSYCLMNWLKLAIINLLTLVKLTTIDRNSLKALLMLEALMKLKLIRPSLTDTVMETPYVRPRPLNTFNFTSCKKQSILAFITWFCRTTCRSCTATSTGQLQALSSPSFSHRMEHSATNKTNLIFVTLMRNYPKSLNLF